MRSSRDTGPGGAARRPPMPRGCLEGRNWTPATRSAGARFKAELEAELQCLAGSRVASPGTAASGRTRSGAGIQNENLAHEPLWCPHVRAATCRARIAGGVAGWRLAAGGWRLVVEALAAEDLLK